MKNLLLALSLFLALVTPALADYTTSVQVNLQAVTSFETAFDVHTNAPSSVAISISGGNDIGSGTSRGSANAAAGVLGVHVEASSSESAFTEAVGAASFTDYITVNSDTLPLGALVMLTLSQNVAGGFGAGGRSYRGELTSQVCGPSAQCYGESQSATYIDDLGLVVVTGFSGSPTLTTTVGATFILSGGLNVLARAGLNSSITGGFGQTVHYYLDSQTPGVTLSSSSNHDYSTPVPEPTSFVSLGIGVLGLLRRVSLRRRRDSLRP